MVAQTSASNLSFFFFFFGEKMEGIWIQGNWPENGKDRKDAMREKMRRNKEQARPGYPCIAWVPLPSFGVCAY